ncbi:hypothetical protein L596_000533 [Steinernema carpocapsae]|uniref:Uncharacterized protein n=1 Tax=Steinernema carpocapsae TaxID=34508 RepID=A0A4U8UMM3_STECR|nr:hypothetical protein L596_000533 [Steinernema carpocapsae]
MLTLLAASINAFDHMTFPGRHLRETWLRCSRRLVYYPRYLQEAASSLLPPLPGGFGTKTIMKMFKPKPKMLQKASPSLLSPLFERDSLEPVTSRVRKLGSAVCRAFGAHNEIANM